jgi:diadenosine tetraphosphate (Ap4A) HIT family hydrolase
MTCSLCTFVNNPADDVVWHFPHSIARLGPWQYHTGYCVLVARTHAAELHHLPDDERAAFLDEMVLLNRAIDTTFQPRKMNCEMLGNQVPHLHWHLFPRRFDDPEALKAAWLAIDRAERDEQEKQRLQLAPLPRTEIINRLRATLQKWNAPTL